MSFLPSIPYLPNPLRNITWEYLDCKYLTGIIFINNSIYEVTINNNISICKDKVEIFTRDTGCYTAFVGRDSIYFYFHIQDFRNNYLLYDYRNDSYKLGFIPSIIISVTKTLILLSSNDDHTVYKNEGFPDCNKIVYRANRYCPDMTDNYVLQDVGIFMNHQD